MSRLTDRLTRLAAVVPPRFQPVAAAVAAVLVAAGGLVGAVTAMAAAAPLSGAAGLSDNWYEGAPYYYAQDSQGPSVAQVMSATGEKAFDMAFILSGGSCSPSWEGNDPVSSDTQAGSLINQVRANGGDVIVSMGGYNGTKLGQVCGSAAATAAAYQQVISKYSLHAFDFDLEEPEIENSNAIANELGAAQILQRNNPGLFESVTMPTTASGANYFGQLLLDEAKSLGYTPQDYSIMPFDGGFNGASAQIQALQGFHTQLMNTFGWSSSMAYAHEGFSGMNGRTDSAEYFYQSDFQSVLSFAENNGMSRFTFWSLNRDRQCNPPNNNGNLSSECSSVPQVPWAFTAYAVAFANSGPVVPPSPSPSPSGGGTGSTGGTGNTGGGGGCPSAWVSNTAYTSGNTVASHGHKWTANQWNYGEVPGGSSGAWNDNGPC